MSNENILPHDNQPENLNLLINENRRLRKENAELLNRVQSYSGDLVNASVKEKSLRAHYRTVLRNIRDMMGRELELQEKSINGYSQRVQAVNTLGFIEPRKIKNSLSVQHDLLDDIDNESKRALKTETHLDSTISKVEELILDGGRIFQKICHGKSLAVNLEFDTSDEISNFYILHDMYFLVEMFEHMVTFLSETHDQRYAPPRARIVTRQAAPGYCYVGIEFLLSKPEIIYKETQAEFERFFENEDKIPESWVHLNQNLVDVFDICSQYSTPIRLQRNKFGRSVVSIGRNFYIQRGPELFKGFLQACSKFKASKVQYIGLDKEREMCNSTAGMLKNIGMSFQYVPAQEWSVGLVSRTRWVFINPSVEHEHAVSIIQSCLDSPFTKIKFIALDRNQKDPFKHKRVFWLNENKHFLDILELLGI